MNPTFSSPFVYIACQHGAEPFLKGLLTGPDAPYRLAYSQKGLVTLKSTLSIAPWSRALPRHPLIRSRGHILGKFEGELAQSLIQQIVTQFAGLDWTHLHVWQRDIAQPGWHGFEPGRSALASFLAEEFSKQLSNDGDRRIETINLVPTEEARILEVIIDEPNRWWVATKPTQELEDHWIGGSHSPQEPQDMISRAYLKLGEAIQWSGIVIHPNDKVVEIGSAPGGACQLLIDLGAKVTGVDPADMDERMASHPSFEHWRSRSLQVKRKDFSPFRYLVCDANVAPNYTLKTIEAIVSYPTSKMEGLILTMKLSSWDQAALIPEHVERVKSWGFANVRARQLSHNRREYCIVALR